MHSVLKHNIPIKKGVVRVDDFHQMLAVESAPSGGSKGKYCSYVSLLLNEL